MGSPSRTLRCDGDSPGSGRRQGAGPSAAWEPSLNHSAELAAPQVSCRQRLSTLFITV